MLYRSSCLVVAVAALVPAGSEACEPIWVRPLNVSIYSAAFVGKVESVDWLRGRVRVAQTRVLIGRPAQTAEVKFNNIPLTCAWQLFRPGEGVYVFEDDAMASSWAAPIGDVNFDHDQQR